MIPTIENWLIDVDNTLYPNSCGMFAELVERIYGITELASRLPRPEAIRLAHQYFDAYGNTMIGLTKFHNMTEQEYLDYIYDLSVEQYVTPNKNLRCLIERLPGKRYIFTNAVHPFVQRVFAALGVDGMFDGIVDALDLLPYAKPDHEAFRRAFSILGITNPAACGVIDDTPGVIQKAKELGLFTVQVGTTTPNNYADCVVEKVEDLLRYLALF